MSHPSCAGAHPITLSAAKSALGHTETAAGAVGILQATGRLAGHTHPELLHLRSLNPYVASTLASSAKASASWMARSGHPVNESSGIRQVDGVRRSGGSGRFGLHCGFVAARQPQPMMEHLSESQVEATGETAGLGAVGISAFAFQGTNAHVLLSATTSVDESVDDQSVNSHQVRLPRPVIEKHRADIDHIGTDAHQESLQWGLRSMT